MSQKIVLGEKEFEYDPENLSDTSKAALSSLQFISKRIQEISNMQAVMQRAKNSYVTSLKKEMLSEKAGFTFEEN